MAECGRFRACYCTPLVEEGAATVTTRARTRIAGLVVLRRSGGGEVNGVSGLLRPGSVQLPADR